MSGFWPAAENSLRTRNVISKVNNASDKCGNKTPGLSLNKHLGNRLNQHNFPCSHIANSLFPLGMANFEKLHVFVKYETTEETKKCIHPQRITKLTLISPTFILLVELMSGQALNTHTHTRFSARCNAFTVLLCSNCKCEWPLAWSFQPRTLCQYLLMCACEWLDDLATRHLFDLV